MSAKNYTLNNGVSMPAIGEYGPTSVFVLGSCSKLTAYGGFGGRSESARDQFAPTFGLALKVGASSSAFAVGESSLVYHRRDIDISTELGGIVSYIFVTTLGS